MKIKNLFRRTGIRITGTDTKALLIKHALRSEDAYQDLIDVLDGHMITPEKVIPVINGLSRATGELIKALEGEGYLTRKQFKEMLNVWLNDVDDDSDPFYSVKSRFDEYRRICG